MIEKIYLPLWAQYCMGRLEYEEHEDGSITITGCPSKHECYGGCDPTGAQLRINPLKLKLVDEYDSMLVLRNGIWMRNDDIEYLLEKYKKSEKHYVYWRGISGDLDTVRIWEVQ